MENICGIGACMNDARPENPFCAGCEDAIYSQPARTCATTQGGCAMRNSIIAAVTGVIMGAALAAGIAVAVVHARGPRACSHPSLPSGDAARMWIPQVHAAQTFVCTDGTWVYAAGYGD